MYPTLEPAQHQPTAGYPAPPAPAPAPAPDAYYQPLEKPTQPPPPGPHMAIPAGGQMHNPQGLVIQAPPAAQQPGYWSTGLCDCFSDAKSCCLVCWCPCVAFGQLSEIVDKGSSSCAPNAFFYMCLCTMGAFGAMFGVPLGCQWIYSCTYRGKIKQELGLPPSCCEECCIHFWCEPCALCQEYREVQNQGYDLSLGWNGNMEKRRQGHANGTVAAPMAPSMTR